MHKPITTLLLLVSSMLAQAQLIYQHVLEPEVGRYSAVVGAVPKGMDGAVLLAEYADLTDTTDSGLRLFEVDGMGIPLWSRRFTFDSLGYTGGYDEYLTRFGTKVLAEHPDGGYVFVGKAPGVDSTGLLLRTDGTGNLLWWKETPAVPWGLFTFPNGDIVVHGWAVRFQYGMGLERYNAEGDLLVEGATGIWAPVKNGVALTDSTMALMNGEGLERNLALVTNEGVELDAYYVGGLVDDIVAGPDQDVLVSRSNMGSPQTHLIVRFDEALSPSPAVVWMDGAPVSDQLQAMVLSPGNGLFLTGMRRINNTDSGQVVVYRLDAGYALVSEYLLDPNTIGTYPTLRSIGYCLAACADGSVVVGGMADEDDGTTPQATGYYARLADPSTNVPRDESTSFQLASLGHGRYLINTATGAAREMLITDVLGHVVERSTVRTSPVMVDLSSQTSGVYLISLHGADGSWGAQRIVLE